MAKRVRDMELRGNVLGWMSEHPWSTAADVIAAFPKPTVQAIYSLLYEGWKRGLLDRRRGLAHDGSGMALQYRVKGEGDKTKVEESPVVEVVKEEEGGKKVRKLKMGEMLQVAEWIKGKWEFITTNRMGRELAALEIKKELGIDVSESSLTSLAKGLGLSWPIAVRTRVGRNYEQLLRVSQIVAKALAMLAGQLGVSLGGDFEALIKELDEGGETGGE